MTAMMAVISLFGCAFSAVASTALAGLLHELGEPGDHLAIRVHVLTVSADYVGRSIEVASATRHKGIGGGMGETTEQYLARLKSDNWAIRQAARNATSQAFKRGIVEANMASGRMRPLLEDLEQLNRRARLELDVEPGDQVCERCGRVTA